MSENQIEHEVDMSTIDQRFPTHRLSNEFWEELGRTIGCYGFLEDTLARATFAITSTTKFSHEEIELEYTNWLRSMENILSETLNPLIGKYENAFQNHQGITQCTSVTFFDELRAAAKIRNVLCHACWEIGDNPATAKPRYFDKRLGAADMVIDIKYLVDSQNVLRNMIVCIINSVTTLGFNFPGQHGPGKNIR